MTIHSWIRKLFPAPKSRKVRGRGHLASVLRPAVVQLEERVMPVIDLFETAPQPILVHADTVWNEPVVVHGNVTVKFISVAGTGNPEPSLLVDLGAVISGNGDGTPDSLTLDVGATFKLKGQVQKGGTPAGGLLSLNVEAGGRANTLIGPAINLQDGSIINLPGGTVNLTTNRGVDLNLFGVTPFFKDKAAQTGIEVGDMDITAANVALYSTATTSKFADFVLDQISLATPGPGNGPMTTASYSGPVEFVLGAPNLEEGGLDTDVIRRASGSWIADGFKEGQAITIPAGFTNAGTYLLASVEDLELELSENDSLLVGGQVANVQILQEEQLKTVERVLAPGTYGTLTFTKGLVDPVTQEPLPPTITRTTGSWVADRFLDGFKVRLAGGSGPNTGKTFTVTAIDDLTLTLDLTDELTVVAETGNGSYTVSQTQNLPNVPISAVDASRTLAPGTPVVVKNQNTLTRLTGTWEDDGFAAGDTIAIEETLGLDGVYRIVSINGADSSSRAATPASRSSWRASIAPSRAWNWRSARR